MKMHSMHNHLHAFKLLHTHTVVLGSKNRFGKWAKSPLKDVYPSFKEIKEIGLKVVSNTDKLT